MRLERANIGGEVDVAIVGAGIAGLYLAYRITHERPDLSVAVLEASDRLGGRLRSIRRHDGAVLECGASFVSNAHVLTCALARALKCSLVKTKFRCGGAYLRGCHEPRSFNLAPNEQNQSAAALVLEVLHRLLTEQIPALAMTSALAAKPEHLRALSIDGRGLCDWSIGALLRRSLSDEAFALARATHGSTAAFGEANAYDSLLTQIFEATPGQTFFQFEHGFESLALALADATPNARAALGHKVVSVRRHGRALRVRATTNDGATELTARHVFLALPWSPLKRVRFSPDLARPWCGADINAISPVRAFKLFMEFEEAWWREEVGALGGGDIAAIFTDLPLQQLYFHGPERRQPMMMAAFADSHGAEYWAPLRTEPRGAESVGAAPPAMLAAAMRELRRIYPSAPNPRSGVFADWAQGAWHAWKPGARSWEVEPRMQQPVSDVSLFVCGEAFSHLQGWAEGALDNAEATLERALGLDRPHWLDVDIPFQSKGTKNADVRLSGSSR